MVKFSLKDLAKRLGAQCAVVLCGKSFVLPDLNIPYVTLRMRCSDRAVDEAHEALKLVRSGRVTSGRIAIEG